MSNTQTATTTDVLRGVRTEVASDAWHYGYTPCMFEEASIEWVCEGAAVWQGHTDYMKSIGFHRWASYQGRISYYSSTARPGAWERSFVFLNDGLVVEVSPYGSRPYHRISDGSRVER